jgi:hypothetical protein
VADKLPSDWVVDGWGNSNAWEEDFKRTDMGGTNSIWVDASDLVYFSGHGTTATDAYWGSTRQALLFADTSHDDSTCVPGEAHDAWGDSNAGEMEWMCFSACETMIDRDYWAATMYGLHLICGWKTVMLDVDMGTDFGRYLNGTSIFDPAKKVKTAWFDAAEATHGSGYTALVVGETSAMGDDYVWGEGSVSSDPTHNAYYTYWTYNTAFSASDQSAAAPEDSPAPPPSHPMVFPAHGPNGVSLVIDQALLGGADGQTQMRVFNVVPVNVDNAYVQNIANTLCASSQLLCGADIGPEEDQAAVNAIDGAVELRVRTGTGAVHLENTDRWLFWQTAAPELPAADAAVQMANNLLETWDLRPPGAQLDGIDYAVQGERVYVNGDWQDVPETSFPTAIRVRYRRQLGPPPGMPVHGAGGSLTLAFGNNGEFQRLFRGAWRSVTPGALVDVLPVQAVLDRLAESGADATINGITPVAYAIQINSVSLGYYEPGSSVDLNALRPVYRLDATITETPPGQDPVVQTAYPIYMWADVQPPRAQILAPEDGSCVAPGSQVCFQGTATDGVPPYVFRWVDDFDGLIGTEASVCATLSVLSDPLKPITSRTVKLIVRDARGSVSRAFVSLCIGLRGDLNCDGVVNFDDINPFVLALSDPAGYQAAFPNCHILNGDCNGDGYVDCDDINPFVAILSGGGGPCP